MPKEDKLDILGIVEAAPIEKRDVIAMFGIARSRYFRWQMKYYLDDSLEDERGRYPRHGKRLEDLYREQIIQIRNDGIIGKYVIGPEQIMGRLEDKGVFISHETIRQVLHQEGLIEPQLKIECHEYTRFEADSPNDLWQMDILYVFVMGYGYYYLVNILDDYSRKIMHWELVPHATAHMTVAIFDQAIDCIGITPKRILTDHGKQFFTGEGQRKGQFERFCERCEIQHVLARVHHPQTLGKVERYHRTLRQECLNHHVFLEPMEARRIIRVYVQDYNTRRKHKGIGRVTPEQRYTGQDRQIIEQRNQLRQQIIKARQSRRWTEPEIYREIATTEVLQKIIHACQKQEVMV